MKKLQLQNQSFKGLVSSYKEWLDILGYAESTVNSLPVHLQEFLYYLEQQRITTIRFITTERIKEYYRYLQERSNQRRSSRNSTEEF